MTPYEKWMAELKAEDGAHKMWRKQAKEVEDRYRDEQNDGSTKYNILWANTDVQHNAVLSNRPKPDVTRRYKDPDEVSRQVAELTERALSYSVDTYDFDGQASLAVDDYLITGLGQIRLRYTPYFGEGERPKIPLVKKTEVNGEEAIDKFYDGEEEATEVEFDGDEPYMLGEPEQTVDYEEVQCESVAWSRFRWQPTNIWEAVGWCCIEHYLTKEEVETQYDEKKADELTYGYKDPDDEDQDDDEDKKPRALFHEIFDKEGRKVIVICDGNPGFLDEQDDPLNLESFYPFPKPMMFGNLSDKLIPSPEYLKYQDQAEELDQVTGRIRALTKELKWNGCYDAAFGEVTNLQDLGDGEFTPVDGWLERFGDKAPALESAFAYRPLERLRQVIMDLHKSREGIKQTIYEITGLSDIVRGATKANETLGAQQLKQQNSGLRLNRKQNEVSRFIRDVYRLKAEIMVEQFDVQTLTLMTGIDVTPEIEQVLKNDLMRSFAIDIETDSTVAADRAEDQKNAIDLMTAVSGFAQQAPMLLQAGVPIEAVKEMVLFVVRRFKGGRQLEQIINKIPDQGAMNGAAPAIPGAEEMGGAPPQLPV